MLEQLLPPYVYRIACSWLHCKPQTRPLLPAQAAAMALLQAGLHRALLLELPAGTAFWQSSHAVLLRGQLAAAHPVDAPRLLPFLADPRLGLGGPAEHQWRAGSKGALLLVWLTAAGEEPPGWAEAQQAAAAAAAAAVREGCGTAEQQPSGSSGAPARRLMPWQHPFVRRLKPGA